MKTPNPKINNADAQKENPTKDKDRRSPDAVHGSRFEVDEDCSWNKLASFKIGTFNLEIHISEIFYIFWCNVSPETSFSPRAFDSGESPIASL